MTQQETKAIALTFENEKKLSSQFNARRFSKDIQFRVEISNLEKRIRANPTLAKCTNQSLADTLLEAGTLGLTMHPKLGYAYPIPYFNRELKVFECELQIGYQGMENIVLKSGTVLSIQCVIVYRNDPVFKVWNDENGRHLDHQELMRGDRGTITHVYCLARYTNGGYHIEVMDNEQIKQCEKIATERTGGGKVWRGPFREEMVKKAVLRRAFKHWPKDDVGQMAVLMESMDRKDPLNNDSPIKINQEPSVTITEEDELSMHAFLTDNGLTSELASKWLKKMAERMGISNIVDLPFGQLDEVNKLLAGYLTEWKKKQ